MVPVAVPSAAVVGVSQACSLVMLLVLLPWLPPASSWGWLPWAIVAGLAGSLALVCFYRALAFGTVGVVSPISALGTSVPVVAGLAREVREAQIARAATHSVRAFAVPLLVRALRDADAIGDALAARGFDD